MTFKKTLEVWWSFIWRYMIMAFGTGFTIGVFLGLFGITVINANLIGFILFFPISFLCFHVILKKYFDKK